MQWYFIIDDVCLAVRLCKMFKKIKCASLDYFSI